ncbi:MAG: hypothetical protein LUH22_16430 [Bacteroides sp.]|nr:hypothetical protein [Bacteroides sp.]
MLILNNTATANPVFTIKLITSNVSVSGAYLDCIITKTENKYEIFLTGCYVSSYQNSVCIAQGGESYLSLVEDNTKYEVSTLNAEITFKINNSVI